MHTGPAVRHDGAGEFPAPLPPHPGPMATTPAASPPPARRLLWTVLMVLIPVLFFVLLEGGLRLVGYGDDYPLFIPAPDAPAYRYQNPEVARRYFVRQQNVPNSLYDFFLAEKDTNTLRIVVQGGSSAAGYPYYRGGSFSRMLEQRLLQTFPGRNVEVVNTAMAAVNSFTLLDLADEIIAIEPDAVLIYAGHNEYYGVLGVGSAESLGTVRAVVNLYLRLQHLRLVQGLRALLAAAAGTLAGDERPRPGHTLMERMVREQSIPYGSPLYERGLRQFQGNLRDLLARYRDAGIPVYIGTVASNERDHPPFISGLAEGTPADRWEALMQDARRAAAAGDTARALARYDEAIALDSLAAEAFYRKAQVLDAAGRYAEARAAYRAAIDRDQLRFRAPEAINAIIRAEAARAGAVVVETQAALAAASPGGIIGHNLMLEHLHPNVDGYFLIADAFYEALRAESAFGVWPAPVPADLARQEVLLTAVDSLMGVYRIRQLMNNWPFQPPGVTRRDTLRPTTPVEQLAVALLRDQRSWGETITLLRQYYEQQGDYRRALQAALALVQEYPFAAAPYLDAGNVLVKAGRYDEALSYFLAAHDREPLPAAQRMIGSILLRRGERAAAIGWLERSLQGDPDHPQTLYNLAGAYALEGRFAEARRTVIRLLERHPDHADARRLLGSLPPEADGEGNRE
ncbi:MAG: tetratricopeptide repeat protein [Bacteroidetes bacterium]|nr:MAG: tetratricopeptide repeat protein [Bacteroidota bacterium]